MDAFWVRGGGRVCLANSVGPDRAHSFSAVGRQASSLCLSEPPSTLAYLVT